MAENQPSAGYEPLTEEECLQDCHDSYYAAIAELRRRFLAGEPLDQRSMLLDSSLTCWQNNWIFGIIRFRCGVRPTDELPHKYRQ